MHARIPLENKKWLEVRALIEQGNDGYYVERAGYYDIILPDALVQCQLPAPATLDKLPDVLKAMFNRKHCDDFELNYKPRMLRSTLSD